VRELHSDVLLKVPLPSNGLPAGARGVVVHVHAQGEAYEVEFMTPAGETIAVVTVAEEQLEPSPQNAEAAAAGQSSRCSSTPSGATARPTAGDRPAAT
jgi:hypothetical protein